ncbi:hypothetical protein SLE2022_070440 [Rubroshorea leprosula]
MAGQSDLHVSLISAEEVEFMAELAVALKKRGKCALRPPQWMSVGQFSVACFLCHVISLTEDIRDVRLHKVETSTSLEKFRVNLIHPFVGRAPQAFYKHDNLWKIPHIDTVSSEQPQAANREPRRPLRR